MENQIRNSFKKALRSGLTVDWETVWLKKCEHKKYAKVNKERFMIAIFLGKHFLHDRLFKRSVHQTEEIASLHRTHFPGLRL